MKIAKYYVINLPHRIDRRQECIEEFEKANITNYEFVDSIHWNTLTESNLEDYINREYRHVTKDKFAKYALVGCGLSHLKAFKKFIDDYGISNDTCAVILEDDFKIIEHEKISYIIDETINKTQNWDFIYLGGLKDPKNDKRKEYINGLEIAVSVWNAHAYIVHNDMRLFKQFEDVTNRGYFADRGWRKIIRDNKQYEYRYLITTPYHITQRKTFSDINRKTK